MGTKIVKSERVYGRGRKCRCKLKMKLDSYVFYDEYRHVHSNPIGRDVSIKVGKICPESG